uniref:Anion-transporting ATPase-like domain-containing protein n=1 Tax=Ditylenchus dipsaci TaxID=166011 RepID=A0A915DNS0_9BILA
MRIEGDAFNQKFTKTPIKVNGFDNLFAMEVDGSGTEASPDLAPPGLSSDSDIFSMGKNMLSEMAGGLPGIDEATSFSQMIKLVQSMDFEFPSLIEKSLGKLLTLKTQFMPMLSQMGPMLGLGDFSADQATNKLEETLSVVRTINAQFKDPELTTFVCVCIAEFLSMYETERLIQELTKKEIDTHNIIVNQLLFPDRNPADGVLSAASVMPDSKFSRSIWTRLRIFMMTSILQSFLYLKARFVVHSRLKTSVSGLWCKAIHR